MSRFIVSRNSSDQKFYFCFEDQQGNVLLKSYGYATRSACMNGVESVIRNATDKKRFEVNEQNGNYALDLRAKNGQSTAYSPVFETLVNAHKAVDFIYENVTRAKIVSDED